MNAKKRVSSPNVNLSPEEAMLHEWLALRRLRQVVWRSWRERHRHGLSRALRESGLWLLMLVVAPIEGGELVQEVAPGREPLRRHEWDRVEFRPRF